MNIVIVKWTIKKENESDFLEYWKSLSVNNTSGLFREFLSKVGDDELNTWPFPTDKYCVYINVGIWESAEAFKREIGEYINRPPKSFEAESRQRIILQSVSLDRGGKFILPSAMLNG